MCTSSTSNSETGDGQVCRLPPVYGLLSLIMDRKMRIEDVRKLAQQWNGRGRRGGPGPIAGLSDIKVDERREMELLANSETGKERRPALGPERTFLTLILEY